MRFTTHWRFHSYIGSCATRIANLHCNFSKTQKIDRRVVPNTLYGNSTHVMIMHVTISCGIALPSRCCFCFLLGFVLGSNHQKEMSSHEMDLRFSSLFLLLLIHDVSYHNKNAKKIKKNIFGIDHATRLQTRQTHTGLTLVAMSSFDVCSMNSVPANTVHTHHNRKLANSSKKNKTNLSRQRARAWCSTRLYGLPLGGWGMAYYAITQRCHPWRHTHGDGDMETSEMPRDSPGMETEVAGLPQGWNKGWGTLVGM